MKKKIIIYGVFVTLLFCLIVSSIYAFFALGKKPINDIENESTTVPSITEEFNAVTSKLLNKYDFLSWVSIWITCHLTDFI